MTETEMFQARILELEIALADYIARYGLSETARIAMVGVKCPPSGIDAAASHER
jgi:hypothetical protein